MISLDKCIESCYGINDLFAKKCLRSETNDEDVFNMITKRNEA